MRHSVAGSNTIYFHAHKSGDQASSGSGSNVQSGSPGRSSRIRSRTGKFHKSEGQSEDAAGTHGTSTWRDDLATGVPGPADYKAALVADELQVCFVDTSTQVCRREQQGGEEKSHTG